MPLPVNLCDVATWMEMPSDEFTAYINRRTGELVTVSEEEKSLAEDGDDADWEDLPAWQQEGMPQVKDVLESDDYIALPGKFEIHEWSIMERFSESVENDQWSDELLTAIRGRGAFRYFKDTIHRLGIHQDWYDFRDEALKEIAREFLRENDIPFVERDAGEATPGE